jgi:sirohydrochlorin ferrochelatase
MTSPTPALVLLAHGTRDAAGAAEIDRLAGLVGGQVVVAYADVRPPTLADVLADIPGPAVVVPAFLAAGYHVRVDVPAQLAATDRSDVSLAEPLGPDPILIEVAVQRLRAAGWQSGDMVFLGAAGSTDPQAIADVQRAAAMMSERIGQPVEVGFATGTPKIADLVAAHRAGDLPGTSQAAVASWLLAPGMFQRTLVSSGANVVADPLGAHPRVAAVIRARYAAACAISVPWPGQSTCAADEIG